MSNTRTNKDRIRDHLEAEGHITPVEALIVHGIVRLAPRIQELRDEGLPILTETHTDQAGRPYTRYTLVNLREGERVHRRPFHRPTVVVAA